MLVLSIFLFAACGGKKEGAKSTSSNDTTTLSNNDTSTTQAQPTPASAWEVRELLDDFGQSTGEKCLYTYVAGQFSNSATSGANLYVETLVTLKKAGIFLHLYREESPATKFIGGGGVLKMKNQAGKEISIPISGDWAQTGGLALKGGSYNKFKDYLSSSEGEIICVIKDKYSSVYNYRIDATAFGTQLEGIK